MEPLAAFRRRHLLTQQEAADVIGIGLSTWRQIECRWQGRKAPPWLLNHLRALDLLAHHAIAWPEPTRTRNGPDDQR